MAYKIKKEIFGVCANLKNGLRLVIFKRVTLNEFYVSYEQLIALILLLIVIANIGSYVLSLPKPEFSQYGVATIAIQISFFSLAVYFFSKIHKKNDEILSFFIVILSVWPFFHIVWLVIGNSSIFNYWEFFGNNKYYYIILNIWIAAVVVSSVTRVFGNPNRHLFLTFFVYIGVIAVPLNYFTLGSFWYEQYVYKEEYKLLNQETTYYKQFEFMDEMRKNILPQRHGISDIYFVGFAGYANEDVFMKEVLYAKKMFDDTYDTKGRSIALINNVKTLENIPLASKSNLSLVLEHIGKQIDSKDDVLFLYLTSHGSKKHKLSVKMSPLDLNELKPADLKTALNKSGIKYRILLISACYSGGYIEPLKDDFTLIFTASAKNKTSFGCSNKNDFTYFGRAVFKDNMKNNYNFINAFSDAIESIKIKEKQNKLTHSEPQLFIGDKIREKLNRLTQEIEEYNRNKI
ncbi:hypothetical protein MNBD_GAMMA22-2585 [hydrothermal vent metagenome]|uniref:MORN repeat family protein n=1 Tax=hydrothermal vent metagenome TaxID=652676 RepID=A0A3B1A8C2_9ZZZZ